MDMPWPKGSAAYLEDLEEWYTDFYRVVNHLSGGRGLVPEDLIVQIWIAWPAGTLVGECLREVSRRADYRVSEANRDFGTCWHLLCCELERHQPAPHIARAKAQKKMED